MRTEPGTDIDSMLDCLWRCAAGSIPEWLPMTYIEWLPSAYDVAARFDAARKGRSNIFDIRSRRAGRPLPKRQSARR
jgi:hypothetical protein